MVTRLQNAMYDFIRNRVQFNDEPKLQEIIAAVREEERSKVTTLVEAARAIVQAMPQTKATAFRTVTVQTFRTGAADATEASDDAVETVTDADVQHVLRIVENMPPDDGEIIGRVIRCLAKDLQRHHVSRAAFESFLKINRGPRG